MLARMGQIDPRVDTPLVDWSELGMSGLLPTGTVTLVLADVEGSTRLHAVVGDPTRGNDRGDRAATEEAVACA
jgi:hypothetical protein